MSGARSGSAVSGPAASGPAASGSRRFRGLARRAWRGRPEDPRWARPALCGLLAFTAVLYLWSLGISGHANGYYSAAVQAGSESWKAFFFGSSDAGNAITVDKPPGALWPPALSARLLGFGPWQILVPQALMGVATVAVLHATVARRSGPAAGLIAGVVLAVTPVAALMFRFNNPDALLCLLMVCAVCCVLRALEEARTAWLVLAGVCLGLGFFTKTLQAMLVVPTLAAVYAVCAPTGLLRRVRQLLASGAAMAVVGGWWIAVVELWPSSSRPYIGSSRTNSFVELTFGYNGLGRLNGDEAGGSGAGGSGLDRWSGTSVTRLFQEAMGGQVSWLLPAALVLLLAGLFLTRRAVRDDAQRAAFLVWGGALLTTMVTFSLMLGIVFEYYTVALAPYVAALVGMGTVLLWRARARAAAAITLALVVAGTAVWSHVLLSRTGDWLPWLRWVVLAGGALTALPLLRSAVLPRRAVAVVASAGLAVCLAGPVAYTLSTVRTAHHGSVVTAGPGARHGTGDSLLYGRPVSNRVAAAVRRNAASHTWGAAIVGAQNAARYQLATGHPVLAVGGFSGSDPFPTLARFRSYTEQGRIRYFVAPAAAPAPGHGGPGPAAGEPAARITAWVEEHFTGVTVDGTTLYDLTRPKARPRAPRPTGR